MKLYIKNMVSLRCKMAVKEVLRSMGVHFVFVELGVVETMEDLTAEERLELKNTLYELGLELMDDKKSELVQKVKNLILEMIYHPEEEQKMSFTMYLSQQTNHDYPYLANLFLEFQGTSIQQFIILHKVERIKELILYSDLSITEITWKMNYSSVAHLSNQFKKVTGLTPTHFREMKEKRLDTIQNTDSTLNPPNT